VQGRWNRILACLRQSWLSNLNVLLPNLCVIPIFSNQFVESIRSDCDKDMQLVIQFLVFELFTTRPKVPYSPTRGDRGRARLYLYVGFYHTSKDEHMMNGNNTSKGSSVLVEGNEMVSRGGFGSAVESITQTQL